MGQILCVKKVPFRKSGHIWQNMDNAEFTNILDKPNFAKIGKNMILNVAKTGRKQVYQNLP